MEKTKKAKRSKRLKSFLLGVALVVPVVMIILYVGTTVSRSMEEEQLLTLETVSGKITSNMVDYFEQNWSHLDYIAETMHFNSYETQEDALQTLENIKQAHGLQGSDTLLILVDENGYYYTPDAGRVAVWQSFSSSAGKMSEGARLMINDLAELADHKEQYICFIKELAEPLSTADGNSFRYIILAADAKVFEIDLSMGEFGTITDAFVMSDNGRKVSTQTGRLDISKSYNLLTALKDAEFLLGDSYEQVLSSIEHNESGASLVQYDGKEYFLAHHSMGIQDWNAVFVVERDGMVDRITPTLYQLLGVLIVGFTMLTLVIVGILINRNRNLVMNERLRAAANTAEQENRSKSEFLSRMSHDIRTPLNGIIGMTAIAEKTLDDKESVRSCLKKISVSSDHLLELINEVLEISRIENGKTQVHNAPLDLGDLLERLDNISESRVVAKNLRYEMDTGGLHHPYVIADKTLLNQILLNIIGNAVKYTPEGGTVHCTAYSDLLPDALQAEYHFIVSDTGIGMSPEFMEHIFDRFAQEEIGARTTYEGTGLGMAITKELVDLLGGTITVKSKKGEGSTFEVTLKLSLCTEAEIKEPETVAEATAPERRYHVLLVEDNAINREIAEFLLKDAGIRCSTAEDGLQAVKAFEASTPGEYDAILMDIMMPNMNGLEATRAIRAMERPDAARIPIFATTANAYREDSEKSLAAGMNAHLTKPLVLKEILQALATWCDKE